ncbi:MAG: 3-hydroxyacyl-ACP dehydratase FabZ family protein [Planctomycetota bacterium]
MRFTLIDKVLEQDDERIVAVKNVSSAEEYLDDHFPSFPVLPGVMMLETMVQAARTLIRSVDGPPKTGNLVIAEVKNLRYAAMVRPGQALQVEVTLRKRGENGDLEFQGTGTVEGEVAVQGRFRLSPLVPLNPSVGP